MQQACVIRKVVELPPYEHREGGVHIVGGQFPRARANCVLGAVQLHHVLLRDAPQLKRVELHEADPREAIEGRAAVRTVVFDRSSAHFIIPLRQPKQLKVTTARARVVTRRLSVASAAPQVLRGSLISVGAAP